MKRLDGLNRLNILNRQNLLIIMNKLKRQIRLNRLNKLDSQENRNKDFFVVEISTIHIYQKASVIVFSHNDPSEQTRVVHRVDWSGPSSSIHLEGK